MNVKLQIHYDRWHALPLTFVRKFASEENPSGIRFQHENAPNHIRAVLRKLSDFYLTFHRKFWAAYTSLTATSSAFSPIRL